MLEQARTCGAYDDMCEGNIEDWACEGAGLIYSNAALHWLDDHDALFPRLVAMLARGGTLAVQMPHQNNAPSHRVWRSLAEEMFPERFERDRGPAAQNPQHYYQLLSQRGEFSIWETEYYQALGASDVGHPVRRFTESTYARPILAALDESEGAALISRYDAVMEKAYPRSETGTVLFPFRRLFFTLTV